MNKPILYHYETNSASRFVMMVALEIGLEMEYRAVNMMNKEQFLPEFTKINPLASIPFLDDNGFYVRDCHAISTYIVSKYGKTDKLYPKELLMRTKIDSTLYFDGSVMYGKLLNLMEPIFYYGAREIPQKQKDDIEKCYDNVEMMFTTNSYVIGDDMTLADLAIFATFGNMFSVVPMVDSQYPKIAAWWQVMCQLPYYKDVNQHGSDEFKKYFLKYVEKNQSM